jgi:hypothetical protein
MSFSPQMGKFPQIWQHCRQERRTQPNNEQQCYNLQHAGLAVVLGRIKEMSSHASSLFCDFFGRNRRLEYFVKDSSQSILASHLRKQEKIYILCAKPGLFFWFLHSDSSLTRTIFFLGRAQTFGLFSRWLVQIRLERMPNLQKNDPLLNMIVFIPKKDAFFQSLLHHFMRFKRFSALIYCPFLARIHADLCLRFLVKDSSLLFLPQKTQKESTHDLMSLWLDPTLV